MTYAQQNARRAAPTRARGGWRHAVVATIMICSLALAFSAGRVYDHYFGVACLNTVYR